MPKLPKRSNHGPQLCSSSSSRSEGSTSCLVLISVWVRPGHCPSVSSCCVGCWSGIWGTEASSGWGSPVKKSGSGSCSSLGWWLKNLREHCVVKHKVTFAFFFPFWEHRLYICKPFCHVKTYHVDRPTGWLLFLHKQTILELYFVLEKLWFIGRECWCFFFFKMRLQFFVEVEKEERELLRSKYLQQQ